METGKNDFKLLFFLLVADSSLSASEMLAKKLSVYHSSYHLILSSKVKGFLKEEEWVWDIFMFEMNTIIIIDRSAEPAD